MGKILNRCTVGKVKRDLSMLKRDDNGNLPVTDTLFLAILAGTVVFFYLCLNAVVYLIKIGVLPRATTI